MFETYVADVRAYLTARLTHSPGTVPVLPLHIQLHIADTRLVSVAKQGFPKMPLPIRNVLMAIVEFEREESKTVESYTNHNLQVLVASLDTLISNVSSRIELLHTFQEGLVRDLLPLWYDDIRSRVDSQLSPTDPWTDLCDKYATASTATVHSHTKKSIVINPSTVNLSSVEARLELSKQYRLKAAALTNGQFTDALAEITVIASDDTATPSTFVTGPPVTDDLSKMTTMRTQAARLWLPYRKTIVNALSGLKHIEDLKRAIQDVIAGTHAIPQLKKDTLQHELKFAVASFPCDPSMLRTCLTACSDGVKLSHTRKMMEIKNECTRQIGIRLAQLTSLFDDLEGCLAAKTFA